MMRGWAAILTLLLIAISPTQSAARRIVSPPHYTGIDDAVARSDGFWRLTHTTPERRVRADSVGLSCIERVGEFELRWLSIAGDYCSYTLRRAGPSYVIYVQLQPLEMTLEDVVRGWVGSGRRNESRAADIGRCQGLLARTTIDPAQGVHPNGRPWHTEGSQLFVYALQSPTQMLSIRLLSEGPPPYHDSDEEVIRLAHVSMDCPAHTSPR
jgi:hypothetical protein